jgi:hypothetical protein
VCEPAYNPHVNTMLRFTSCLTVFPWPKKRNDRCRSCSKHLVDQKRFCSSCGGGPFCNLSCEINAVRNRAHESSCVRTRTVRSLFRGVLPETATDNACRHCDAPCGASARYCTSCNAGPFCSIVCEAKDWKQQHDSSVCSWVNPLLDEEGLYFGHRCDLELAQQIRPTSRSPTDTQSQSETVSASSSGVHWHATSVQPVSGWESESSDDDLDDGEDDEGDTCRATKEHDAAASGTEWEMLSPDSFDFSTARSQH